MMLFKFPTVVFVGLLLFACAKEEPKNSTPTLERPNPPTAGTPNAELKASFIGTPVPNQYHVRLEWTALKSQSDVWVLLRHEAADGLKHLTTLGKDRQDFTDTQVIAGKQYLYSLATFEGAQHVTHAQVTLTIPQDLEISRTTRLKEITGISRLFLRGEGNLQTHGDSLYIDVDEIIADGGAISTFPEGHEAAIGTAGRPGGTIVVRAKRGKGRLRVLAFGEQGGPGLDGASGSAGANGANGKVGVPIDPALLLHVPPAQIAQFPRCAHPPTNGDNGGPGGMGGNGGAGARGGDSGKVYVEITDPTQIEIEPTHRPGPGGRAGKGGNGGPGGAGGKAGSQDPHKLCPPAADGRPGSQGPKGMDGPMGAEGELLPFCLKLGTATHGRCDAFTITAGRVW